MDKAMWKLCPTLSSPKKLWTRNLRPSARYSKRKRGHFFHTRPERESRRRLALVSFAPSQRRRNRAPDHVYLRGQRGLAYRPAGLRVVDSFVASQAKIRAGILCHQIVGSDCRAVWRTDLHLRHHRNFGGSTADRRSSWNWSGNLSRRARAAKSF